MTKTQLLVLWYFATLVRLEWERQWLRAGSGRAAPAGSGAASSEPVAVAASLEHVVAQTAQGQL